MTRPDPVAACRNVPLDRVAIDLGYSGDPRDPRRSSPPGAYQSITLDSVSFPSVPFPSQSRMAWMAMTAPDRNLISSHSFRVPGSGWRFEGWKPASPPVSVTKRATVMSGGPRATLKPWWAAGGKGRFLNGNPPPTFQRPHPPISADSLSIRGRGYVRRPASPFGGPLARR